MQPSAEWLTIWRMQRTKTVIPADLNEYFTKNAMAGKGLDRLSLGMVSVPTGFMIACDPLYDLSRYVDSYFACTPTGSFPVTASIIKPDIYDCTRYAALQIKFSDAPAIYYEEALNGSEDLRGIEEGNFFGFEVASGLACFGDAIVRNAAADFFNLWFEENPNGNIYDDYFKGFFIESAINYPHYQRDQGDWLNWRVPGTDYTMVICQTGFGDGVYPVYFGRDAADNICQLVALFIDIELVFN